MTTAELIDELRRKLGNRTDIAEDRYARWLNWSMYELSGFHRQRVFPSVWFHELEDTVIVGLVPASGTAQAGGALTITLELTAPATAEYYQDAILAITGYDEVAAGASAPEGLVGQQKLIASYSAARVATVDSAWDVEPDEYTEYTIYRKGFRFGVDVTVTSHTDIYAVLKMEVASTGSEVEHVAWETLVYGDPQSVGVPARYARFSDRVLFDSAPTSPVTFRLWVYRYPPQLDALVPDAEPILPEQWHEVILLGALWRGFESLMEPDRAEEAKRQFVDTATNRNSTFAVEAPHIERGIRVRRNY